MDWSERIGWLILGCLIGFALGYIVRSLREIKDELDEVDELVKERLDGDRRDRKTPKRGRGEDGLARYPLLLDIALILVIGLTVFAAFSTQQTNNDLRDIQKEQRATQQRLADTQDRLASVTFCNRQYLARTIDVLNERTGFTRSQVVSNLDLQKAQARFLRVVLVQPPVTQNERRSALQNYFSTLTEFTAVSGRNIDNSRENPPPTNRELRNCFQIVTGPTLKESIQVD